MMIFLLWTGFSFFLDQADTDSPRRVGMIAFGIYAFMAAYSPSEVSVASLAALGAGTGVDIFSTRDWPSVCAS